MSQEKIAQLSSSQTSGSEFLKVLGVEEEPHLLTVLMEKMTGVKPLQTLAELMSACLSELKQGMGNYASVGGAPEAYGGRLVCVCVCVRISSLFLCDG